jgi:hypothetical protein
MRETAMLDLKARLRSNDCLAKGKALPLDATTGRPRPRIRVLLFSPENRADSGGGQFRRFKEGLNADQKKTFIHFFERNLDLLDTEDAKTFLDEVRSEPGYERFRKMLLHRHCGYEREFRQSLIQVRYS